MSDRPEPRFVLSFDVEEHWRIEAAAGLRIGDERKAYYAGRVAPATAWLLEALGRHEVPATFFVVGQLARAQPELVRSIHAAGHEVASHGWDHRRVLAMTPDEFRTDIRQSKDALEQIIGEPVVGYRAPTFSVMRQTAWALDILSEEGMLYDSSVYPVRHDRYGIPDAPRWPFRARCPRGATLLELPPARLDWLGLRVPAGGGGYFRLFPLAVMERALEQIARVGEPPVAVLYFHPWEFDPEQDRLPLGRVSRWRTYVGMTRSRPRLERLMTGRRYSRAVDVARELLDRSAELPDFALTA